MGEEKTRAQSVLTDRQLRAYSYYREARYWNWIAKRMGISRTAVIHHVEKAERKMGYPSRLTPKQRSRYRPSAERRLEEMEQNERFLTEVTKTREGSATLDLLEELLSRGIIDQSYSTSIHELPPEHRDYFKRRLADLTAARKRRHGTSWADEDGSRAAGEAEAEFAAELEADFGTNPVTGVAMRGDDFREDNGKGYDAL